MTEPRDDRPPSPSRSREYRIIVRLTRSEYELIHAKARADGDTLSMAVREALYAYGCDPFLAPRSLACHTPR